jgi:site-specific recombinase XerD
LVEHLTFNQGVTGSIPVRPTIHVQSFIFLDKFLQSRRQGSSVRTIEFYECCLKPFVLNYELTTEGINQFLRDRTCGNGKHGYYRAIRAFCNWLYRNGYVKSNPIENVDPPKQSRRLLPCLDEDEVECLIEQASNVRDKAIVSLFVDSGIRLNELVNIKMNDIDWKDRIVTVIGKGSKQRKAPFSKRTADLITEHFRVNKVKKVSQKIYMNIWDMKRRGIQMMLYRLEKKTGLQCNPHTFRRTFASNLHRHGLDVEHIMRLGGWESLDMVLRYTRSVKFEESLKVYRELEGMG